MPSLVPELVKKWCKPISAESHDSVNVRKGLLVNARPEAAPIHFGALSFGASSAAVFAAA